MSIAWRLQSVISGFTSALAGGLLMARAIYNFCSARNITFFGMIPNNHEESYIDEVLSYIFAAAGFYFQFQMRFDLTFPFSLLLWPLGTCSLLVVAERPFALRMSNVSFYLSSQNWAKPICVGPLPRLARPKAVKSIDKAMLSGFLRGCYCNVG